VPERILDYQVVAWLRYRLPVDSLLVLPVERYARGTIRQSARVRAGGLGLKCRFRVVKMWEMDPAGIFALNRPHLLPLVALAASSPADLNRAAKSIVATGDPGLGSIFLTLGELRYDQNELKGSLEKMVIQEFERLDLLRHRRLAEKLDAKAVLEAEQRGERQGELRLLTRFLGRRFPEVVIPAGLEAIEDRDALESLFDEIAQAMTSADAEAALRRAAAPKTPFS
jgi:hypothetical protein